MSTIVDIYCYIFPERFFQEMTRVAVEIASPGGRPQIGNDLRALIRRMSIDNPL